MDDVNGVCDKRFGAARGALARNLDSGEELGASLAVDIDGDLVVDLWGGFRDQARTVPWTEDTITNVWRRADIARRMDTVTRGRWPG